MSPARVPGRDAAPPPARIVHLGLGGFVRGHVCWYTARAGGWTMAAFSGRRDPPLVQQLNAQQGVYTLISRGPERDSFEEIGSLVRAHGASEHERWLDYFAAPELAAVTLTITEAGYVRGEGGGLDGERPEVQADVAALRRDPGSAVRTAPARLLAGLAARRRADAGPLALVPCDNLPGNGAVAARVIGELAERVDRELASWVAASVAMVSTAVDRITPRTTAGDVAAVRSATGREDRCPVVAEPYAEWVLSGDFPAGRPSWEDAGAVFTGELASYERRKLWLLNGAHSLLAYGGPLRGHATVAAAAADDVCRVWMEAWWELAGSHLATRGTELSAYLAALRERFANSRIGDRLERIAADGSQKLPVRVVPVVRAERGAGRLPEAAARIIAAWVCHLRGHGVAVSDARAEEIVPLARGRLDAAVPRVLGVLHPELAEDRELAALVAAQARELSPARER